MPSPITISVIVPVHDRIGLARVAFDALRKEVQHDNFVEVIVIDQNSTDGVDTLANELGFSVHYSDAKTAGALRNAGVALSRSEWLLFVDSDVKIPSGYLARLRTVIASSPAGIIGCNYSLPETTTLWERVWHSLTYESGSGPRDWLNAGNMALPRALFDSIGGFDPSLSSGEDTDLCERVRLAGYSVWQAEEVTAAHLGNPKTLGAFFGKQVWHGQGASFANRNSLAALTHACSTAVALVVAFSDLNLAISAALAANIVPVFALLSLRSKRRHVPFSPAAFVLLHTYFFARCLALFYKSNKQR